MESLLVSGAESFKSLCSLRIYQCPNFVSFWREGLPAPNLTDFEVLHCDKLKSLPDKMSTLLPKLEYLDISNCPEIESFPEGGGLAWPSMGMLTHLYVGGRCDGIKSFPARTYHREMSFAGEYGGRKASCLSNKINHRELSFAGKTMPQEAPSNLA
ncbi:Putative disease resistance protein [Glycine soja]|uniref:Putative disease resistance protein n=1 Tax=Glycine soja TaxID=3848 RepID=A0A0B2R386_GLYSO|nr:Putative disease resistance protein [Glycine soja]